MLRFSTSSLLLLASTLLLAPATSSCGLVDSCEEERRVVESTYIGGEEFGGADLWERQGWDCAFDGTIRDGLGRTLGRRWICTRCV